MIKVTFLPLLLLFNNNNGKNVTFIIANADAVDVIAETLALDLCVADHLNVISSWADDDDDHHHPHQPQHHIHHHHHLELGAFGTLCKAF